MSTRRKKKGVKAEGVDRISMGRRRRAGRMLWLLTKILIMRADAFTLINSFKYIKTISPIL